MHQPIPEQTQPAFAFIGFCCDAGVRRNLGRAGAADGPGAIRHMLAKFPIQRTDVICYDAGDITCHDDQLEGAQEALAEAVSHLLHRHITPIVFGGGHEIAWGHYQGIAKTVGQKQLGIVNFDAHFDMRPLLPSNHGSSGTPFLQIAEAHKAANRHFDYNCIGIQPAGNIRQLFDTAKSYETHMLFADDIHHGHMDQCISFLDRIIADNQIIYLSLCLDVFSSAYAPGVSAPQPLGLTPWQLLPLVRKLASSGKVLTYDVAELAPVYDVDQHTAKLAANFIYDIIHHHVFLK
jgi:formiminoglutamase